MKPKPEAETMRELPYGKFGSGVPRANSRHYFAAAARINQIHPDLPLRLL
jgi:hypothetical protein